MIRILENITHMKRDFSSLRLAVGGYSRYISCSTGRCSYSGKYL
jgi:hypothetical protein